MPGAGHDLTFVQPDLVARRVLAFLDEPIVEPGSWPSRATHPAVAVS